MHGVHDLGCRDCPDMREMFQQWCEAEKMIAMCVGDVNCSEVLAARHDPAQQSLRLFDREKSVHEDGIALAADERRRICYPHQLFLAGWQITSEARAPYCEHIPGQAAVSSFSCSHRGLLRDYLRKVPDASFRDRVIFGSSPLPRSPAPCPSVLATAPAQPHLRFPGNLAHRPRCGRHLYLLLAANTWRMPIAPSGFDQDTPRPTIASLGDTAAVDRVSCGAFGGYETEIPHQLAGVLKARQIADLGQHRHCRNEIDPAHRLQGCDDLGKTPLGHRVTDRLLQTLDDRQ